ncbi:MAG TPA: hypothetical protein VGL86_23390 [Polyangia bacterium]|jgi:hypothetical protein
MTKTKMLGLMLLATGVAACNGSGSSTASSQPLGEKCATNADCMSGEQCLANVCIPQLPPDLGVALCAQTSDCAAKDICVHGVCLPEQSGGVSFCDKDADCAAGDQCLAQVCVPKLPAGGGGGIGLPFDLGAFTGGVGVSCSTNADCTNGNDCAFGLCLPVTTCASDADCSANQKCCTQAGICF